MSILLDVRSNKGLWPSYFQSQVGSGQHQDGFQGSLHSDWQPVASSVFQSVCVNGGLAVTRAVAQGGTDLLKSLWKSLSEKLLSMQNI